MSDDRADPLEVLERWAEETEIAQKKFLLWAAASWRKDRAAVEAERTQIADEIGERVSSLRAVGGTECDIAADALEEEVMRLRE